MSEKRAARLPHFVAPMLAKSADGIPSGDWLYEIKLDGFRALALLGGVRTKLVSRNQNDFAERFPEIVRALESFPVRDSVLDGEVVALDPEGRSSFRLLGDREGGTAKRAPLVYYVFDVLRLAGNDVTHLPLCERKQLLATLFAGELDPLLRFSDSISSDGQALLVEARRLGLEGLIGKKPDSIYEVGRRTGSWLKIKFVTEQEFVVGGFTDPEGGRSHFGALLLGIHVGDRLTYCGSVGSGFSEQTLRELGKSLVRLERTRCPFDNLPEKPASGRAARMTRTEMSRCHWVLPSLVCQVRFSEWTRDAHLRHPVFLGLRSDKAARDVVREPAAAKSSRAH